MFYTRAIVYLLLKFSPTFTNILQKSRVSCQKGPTRHAYAWQIGPIWKDTLEVLLHCHLDSCVIFLIRQPVFIPHELQQNQDMIRYNTIRMYPAKRALSAMRKYGG